MITLEEILLLQNQVDKALCDVHDAMDLATGIRKRTAANSTPRVSD
jgi:hypothetical protein